MSDPNESAYGRRLARVEADVVGLKSSIDHLTGSFDKFATAFEHQRDKPTNWGWIAAFATLILGAAGGFTGVVVAPIMSNIDTLYGNQTYISRQLAVRGEVIGQARSDLQHLKAWQDSRESLDERVAAAEAELDLVIQWLGKVDSNGSRKWNEQSNR